MLIPMAAAGLTGGAAIGFVGSGTLGEVAGSPLVVNLDAGHSVGDLLLLHVGSSNDGGSYTTPTGWTQIWSNQGSTGPDNAGAIFYRFADGTEGATVSVTNTQGGTSGGVCTAYSGVAAVEDTDANDTRDTLLTVWVGTLPTVGDGDWIVAVNANGSDRSHTPPSGWTERYDHFTNATFTNSLFLADSGPVSAAPDPVPAFTTSGSGYNCRGPILLKAA